jgi:nucleoid-associated protein YgaU
MRFKIGLIIAGTVVVIGLVWYIGFYAKGQLPTVQPGVTEKSPDKPKDADKPTFDRTPAPHDTPSASAVTPPYSAGGTAADTSTDRVVGADVPAPTPPPAAAASGGTVAGADTTVARGGSMSDTSAAGTGSGGTLVADTGLPARVLSGAAGAATPAVGSTAVLSSAGATAAAAGATGPAKEESYVVKKGDTYWSIAQAKYGDGTMSKLIEAANKNVPADRLAANVTIKIPAKPAPVVAATVGTGGTSAGTVGSSAVAVAAPVEGSLGSDPVTGKKFYVVKGSDSYWSIAQTLLHDGTKHAEIEAMNPDKKVIRPKEKIWVPERAAGGASTPAVSAAVGTTPAAVTHTGSTAGTTAAVTHTGSTAGTTAAGSTAGTTAGATGTTAARTVAAGTPTADPAGTGASRSTADRTVASATHTGTTVASTSSTHTTPASTALTTGAPARSGGFD